MMVLDWTDEGNGVQIADLAETVRVARKYAETVIIGNGSKACHRLKPPVYIVLVAPAGLLLGGLPLRGSSVSAVRSKRSAPQCSIGRVSACQRLPVVRDRIELSTFRFSE